MKKKFSFFIATVLAIVALPVATFAQSGQTIVDGTVTNNAHAVVSGASVTVTCDGHVQTATTNVNGDYLLSYSDTDCPLGATANVTASKSGQGSGSNSGSIGPTGSSQINIGVVDVSLVPEFGLIGLTGAILIGGGAFMVLRRRQLSGHQA